MPSNRLPTYDAIIVGGGPAGLSAASALGRVRRTTLLIDSGVYRNAQTQQMHDVIGNDGTVPSVFRALARSQISTYTSVFMINGTVASITPSETSSNNSYFATTDTNGRQYLSRKIILATGMRDLLPNTPGLARGFGRGIYWCPWCDGWEHRDKPFANLGRFTPSLIQSTISITALNAQPLMLTNTTFTAEAAKEVTAQMPYWEQRLAVHGIDIENREIVSFERVSGNESDFESDFLVSGLAEELGLVLTAKEAGGDLHVAVDGIMESSLPGVYVVGDANSDASENVPHAMWSAKRAAVNLHESFQHTKRDTGIQEEVEAMEKSLEQPLPESSSAHEWLEYLKQ
ncbi:hypothetical protein P7C71_g5280, partial [Lecanoromycetidae sp. Uapishka_2]